MVSLYLFSTRKAETIRVGQNCGYVILRNHRYIIVTEGILVLKECFVESENKGGGGGAYIN